ncbi:DNA-formamidopyrimidine glycosylase [bacterium]|nr:DNA-formamidopyrimidine glycosylase [bacterium]
MPELPEVETVASELRQSELLKTSIKGVDVLWPRSVAVPSPAEFSSELRDQKVNKIFRRGKFLVMELSSKKVLLVHLRMTGQFYFSSSNQPDEHVRIRVRLENGEELRFRDTRKFGKWYLVDHCEEIIGKLGPEPFDPSLTAKEFHRMLKGRKRQLKPLLLDQEFLAGLGNIYVDEALWESRLNPLQVSSDLKFSDSQRLLEGIRLVLQRGLKNLGTTLGTGKANFYSVAKRKGRNQDELKVFRRTGQPCPRCSSQVKRILVGQRSTHFCSNCQRRRKKCS